MTFATTSAVVIIRNESPYCQVMVLNPAFIDLIALLSRDGIVCED